MIHVGPHTDPRRPLFDLIKNVEMNLDILLRNADELAVALHVQIGLYRAHCDVLGIGADQPRVPDHGMTGRRDPLHRLEAGEKGLVDGKATA